MKKDLPKCQGFENQSFFREHLRRTSIELYEWHLMLFYFWLSNVKHNRIKQISGTPDNDNGECLFLCKECHEKKMASGKYIIEDVIHDPKVDLFPPTFDAHIRQSIRSACDEDFKTESHKIAEEIQNEYGKDSRDFPKNAEKEFAAEYLFGNKLESRKDVEPSNRNNFHWLSIEARCLSIIYEHFFEYRNKFNFEDWDLYIFINSLKDDVIGNCHEMIGYWKLSDEKKKFQSATQKRKRAKRQTWHGLKKEQIAKRNQKIKDKFNNSKLSMNHFAEKYQNEIQLKPSQIRTIIRNAKIK